MQAHAVLVVERGPDGRSLVRELRSGSPLALLPRRGTAAAGDRAVVVHLVNAASTPLAGDTVRLDVHVGTDAHLVLTGVAAAVALPGRDRPSELDVRVTVDGHGSLWHRPEPTVLTARADHRTRFTATLHRTARLRAREVLLLGRAGEPCGRFHGRTRITDDTGPLLAQDLELGDDELPRSPAHLASRRVLAQEVLVWGCDPDRAHAGPWWSLSPLARRGSLATAVGADAVSAGRALDRALTAYPGLVPATADGSVRT